MLPKCCVKVILKLTLSNIKEYDDEEIIDYYSDDVRCRRNGTRG